MTADNKYLNLCLRKHKLRSKSNICTVSIRVLISTIEAQCVRVCWQEGDAWWFSVGTKGPVGVDNPKARPLTGAEDETGQPPGGSALCLISVSHTLLSYFQASASILCFHYGVITFVSHHNFFPILIFLKMPFLLYTRIQN